MLPLRVNDLKQHAYCPRIVFYQYIMPVEKKSTYKMEQGHIAETDIIELEKHRKLVRYGLDKGKRSFHIWVKSEKLGLSGKLDMIIETEEAIYPVDFKMTSGPVHENHLLQIGGYALLLQEMYSKPVPNGFIYLIPQKDVQEIEITSELREKTGKALEDIRNMIPSERMPPATPHRARCEECEFRNYCNDVL